MIRLSTYGHWPRWRWNIVMSSTSNRYRLGHRAVARRNREFIVLAWRLPIMLRNVQSSHPNWCIIIREGCLLWSDLNEKFNLGSRGVEFWKVIGYNATFPRSWRFWLVRLTSSDHLPVWPGNHLFITFNLYGKGSSYNVTKHFQDLEGFVGPFITFKLYGKGSSLGLACRRSQVVRNAKTKRNICNRILRIPAFCNTQTI